MKIGEDTWGALWPFTVPRGDLRNRHGAVTFRAPGGQLHAVNGIARQRFPALPTVEPIWRDHPTQPGLKADLTPILNYGLTLGRRRH